jgi:hypothetical protein
MLAANGLNQKVRTTDAGFSWHKPGVQNTGCKWPKQSLHMPAANDLCRGCGCRLQMACAKSADVGCKWLEPEVQMPAANGMSQRCRYQLQMA